MGQGNIDPEKALMALGKYGKYQLRIWITASLPSLYMAMQMLSMAFVNGKPKFRCSFPNETSPFSISPIGQINDTCFITLNQNTDNENSIHCGENGTKFVYDLNDFGTTIVTEWDLVCEKSSYSEFVGSIFMFGVMVGGMSITPISDKFGRRWTFLICNWLYAIFGLALAFTQNYFAFAFLRFIIGVLTAGVGMVSFVLACEVIPSCWRAYSCLLSCITWCIGFISMGVIAIYVRNWHHFTIILALPAFVSFAYFWFVPETLRWLIVNGKDEEAEKWIRRAANVNKVTVDIEKLRLSDKEMESAGVPEKVKLLNVLNIFKSSILAVQAVVVCYLWLCNAFVYYGLSLFSTQLHGDKYLNFILSGLVELPAYFTAIFLLEKCGRRATAFIFHVVAGVALFILIFIPTKTAGGVNLLPLITTLSLIGKYAISCTFQTVFLFTAELYPTTVRTVGCGLSTTAARIGAILAPYVALLAEINASLPPAIFGSMSLAAAVLTGCLPETKGIELANDIREVKAGPFQKIVCGQEKHPKLRDGVSADTKETEALAMESESHQII